MISLLPRRMQWHQPLTSLSLSVKWLLLSSHVTSRLKARLLTNISLGILVICCPFPSIKHWENQLLCQRNCLKRHLQEIDGRLQQNKRKDQQKGKKLVKNSFNWLDARKTWHPKRFQREWLIRVKQDLNKESGKGIMHDLQEQSRRIFVKEKKKISFEVKTKIKRWLPEGKERKEEE